MWRDKIQIFRKCGKPVSKTRQDKHCQRGARSGVIDTETYCLSSCPGRGGEGVNSTQLFSPMNCSKISPPNTLRQGWKLALTLFCSKSLSL